jgi:hypothetical protein
MRTLIISDLHLGNGGPYDSFAGERELPALIDAYAGSRSRIIVNGDGVDFLMNEEPLALDVARAVAQARSIVAHRASRAVLESMGRALGAGSEVVFRLGNHDIELALPEVQEVLRGALAAPPQIARRLSFQLTRDYGLKFANLLKPDFQGAALAALGVAPAEALYVGDREEDCVGAARAAGLAALRLDPAARPGTPGVLAGWRELDAASARASG